MDHIPTKHENWLTANNLLSDCKNVNDSANNNTQDSNKKCWFAQCNNIYSLNLYSILVRKIDFVNEKESDRIITRFPFLVFQPEESDLIKKKILLVAECARNYFYKSINSKISTWQTRILNYLDRGAMPYPLYRCACEILNLPLIKQGSNAQLFESARGKKYSIPTVISKQLTYLCGVINGDGHLDTHWIRVVDETKEHIKLISEMFTSIFSDSGEIFKTGNAWNVEIRSSSAVRLFNFLTDQTIQGAKYESLKEPLLFKHLGEPYRSLYWRGVMDADGSYKNHISFGSISEQLVNDFKQYLQTLNIESKIYHMKNNAFLLSIPIDYKIAFAREIGVLNPKKKQDFSKLLQRKSIIFNGLNNKNITTDGYFNLTKIKPLYVLGLASFLKEFRKKEAFSSIEYRLSITRGQYSQYEKGTRAIPFDLLFQLFNIQSNDSNLLMQNLENYISDITFQSSTSKPIKLPLKPTSDVIMVMSHLHPLSNWTSIVQTSQHIRNKIQKIFGISMDSNQIRNNILNRFLTTFGEYTSIDSKKLLFDDKM